MTTLLVGITPIKTRMEIGKRERLLVAGIALSPEFIFAGFSGAPDLKGYGVFWLDKKALASAYQMDGAFNHVNLRLAPGAEGAGDEVGEHEVRGKAVTGE